MNIGDVFLRVLADMKDFTADIVKKGGPAADKAGKTLGGKITTGIKGSFSKANLGQALTAGLGIGAGLGAVQLMTQALGGLVQGIQASVNAASDQREAIALSTQVFEEQTGVIDQWADGAAEAFGQSKTEALNFSAAFGTAFKNVGFALDDTTEKSMELTRLAADLGSAFNASSEEAAVALRSGLLGESEPLRRFGVFLSEAAVKQEAYASGIADVGDELTNQQKVLARYQIIMKQTVDSQGAFGRDTGSLADAQKQLGAQVENLSARVGTALIPAIKAAVDQGQEWIANLEEVITVLDRISEALPGDAAGVGLLGDAFKTLNPTDFSSKLEFAVDLLDSLGYNTEEARKQLHGFGLQVEEAEASLDDLAGQGGLASPFDTSKLKADTAIVVGEFETMAIGIGGVLANIKKEVGKAGEDIPVAYAEGIIAEQSVVKTAMAGLINQMETEMTRGEEIAYLIGVLTSEELAQGLEDKRPGVRAQAENTRREAEERLALLVPQGKSIGGKSNEALADGIDSKKPAVRKAAQRTKKLIETNIKPKTKPAGVAAGTGVINGMNTQTGPVGRAASRLANVVVRRILGTIYSSTSGGGVDRVSGGGVSGQRQHGGWAMRGHTYAINEQRPGPPEFFTPTVSGRITPAMGELTDITWSGGGGGTNINLQTYGMPMRAETPSQVVRRIRRASRLGTVSVATQPGSWEQ